MQQRLAQLGLAVCLVMAGNAAVQALSLQEALVHTLQTNPEVLAQASVRRASDNQLRAAYGGFLPQLDISYAIGRENTENISTIQSVNGSRTLTRKETGAVLSQSLFSGLSTVNLVSQRRHQVYSNIYEVNGVAQEIALRATRAYLQVLQREQIVQFAEKTLKAHFEVYQNIKRRSDSGIGKRADLAQALGRLALARTNLLSAQGDLRDAQANYQRVVGISPTNLSVPVISNQFIPGSLDAALTIGKAVDPDILTAQEQYKSSRYQYFGSKANYFPTLDLELSARRNKNVSGVAEKDNQNTALLNFRYNLFRGGADLAQTRQNAWEMQQAKENEARVQRLTEEKIRIAWNTFMTAQMQLEYLREHRDSAKQTREAYEKQFEIGQRSLLDLLDSENELFNTEVAYVNAKFTHLQGKYELLESIGRLLQAMHLVQPVEARFPKAHFFSGITNSETPHEEWCIEEEAPLMDQEAHA